VSSAGEFILHQHSLLGLFCAVKHPPQVKFPGCCCVCATNLEKRHRFFIFCFVWIAALFFSLQVSLGDASTSYEWALILFVLLPLTCFVKSVLKQISAFFQTNAAIVHETLWLRVEEIALLGWLLYFVIAAATATDTEEVEQALWLALQIFVAFMLAEVVSLFWCFFFCRICCPCLVPAKDDMETTLLFNDGGRAEGGEGESGASPGATVVAEAPV
jgi:hypothetical protein